MKNTKKTDELRKVTYDMLKKGSDPINPNALTDALFVGTQEEAFEALKNPDNVKDAGIRMPEQFLYFCHFPRKDEIFSEMSQHFTPHQRDYTFVKLPYIEYEPKHFVEMIKAGINPNTHYEEMTALKVAIACGNIECFKILKEKGGAVTKTIITLQRGKTPCGRPIIEELNPMTYAYYKSKDSMIELVKAAYLEEGKQPDAPFFMEAKASADKLKAEDQETRERIDAEYKGAVAKFFLVLGCALTLASTALIGTCCNKNESLQDNQPQPVLKAEAVRKDTAVSNQVSKPIIKHSSGEKIDRNLRDVKLQRN